MSASRPVPQATEPEKSSRAGRNLPAAIGVGLLLGALIMILAAVGATALSWFIAGGLSRPLETLHQAALRIA